MKIAYVGMGKLGSVCAAVLQLRGHHVRGYDPYSDGSIPSYEAGREGLFAVPMVDNLSELVPWADITFIAVQTPHAPAYGGETPVPLIRRDFEYSYLVQACREVFRAAPAWPITVVIVSTVLPGTINRLIRPIKPERICLVYNPAFIAMGTTMSDFENPEFVLLGADSEADTYLPQRVHVSAHAKPIFVTSIEDAELIKVAYNTHISMKIVWANAMMELCHKTGADCDTLVDALSLATDRVVSSAYMRGGVGDGGACHPRDLIALSYLAEKLDLSVDLMGFLAESRDKQSEWLVDLAHQWSEQTGLSVVLLGKAYKPGVPLTNGSIALLMKAQFKNKGYPEPWIVDPQIEKYDMLRREYHGLPSRGPHVFVVVTKHPEFRQQSFPKGSVVLDPHGYIPDQAGVTVIRIGRKLWISE